MTPLSKDGPYLQKKASRSSRPWGGFTVKLDFEEHTIENSDEFFFEPTDGLITFFPSTLVHRIGINKQKELRYSLAFNFFVKGIFGTQEGELII